MCVNTEDSQNFIRCNSTNNIKSQCHYASKHRNNRLLVSLLSFLISNKKISLENDNDVGDACCLVCCWRRFLLFDGVGVLHLLLVSESPTKSRSKPISMPPNRKTPKAKAAHDVATEAGLKKNDKGEICQWSSTSDDGRLLRMLVENENIKGSMTAGDVRKKYPMFNAYSYSCFNSALTNVKKSYGKEVTCRAKQTGEGGDNGNIESHTNLDDEDDDASDDDSVSFAMSRLSLDDDELTFDTRGSAHPSGKSVTFSSVCDKSVKSSKKSRTRGIAKSGKKNYTKGFSAALPYLVDYWYDHRPLKRASVQVQMLSGNKTMLKRVTWRVSSSQDELIVLCPVSEYMGEPEKAFNDHVLEDIEDEDDLRKHETILKWHPKSSCRRLRMNTIRNGSSSWNVMEFRIPLKFKVSLELASVGNNDPYFYGNNMVTYPDGTVQLHVELISDSGPDGAPPAARNTATFRDIPGSVSFGSSSSDDASYMEFTVGSSPGKSVSSRSVSSRKSTSSRSVSSRKSTSSRRSTSSRKSTSGGSVAGKSTASDITSPSAAHTVKSRKTVAGGGVASGTRAKRKHTSSSSCA